MVLTDYDLCGNLIGYKHHTTTQRAPHHTPNPPAAPNDCGMALSRRPVEYPGGDGIWAFRIFPKDPSRAFDRAYLCATVSTGPGHHIAHEGVKTKNQWGGYTVVVKETISLMGNGVATEHLEGYDAHRSVDLYFDRSGPGPLHRAGQARGTGAQRIRPSGHEGGGVAIRQAQGQVDAHEIRDAGERVIKDMTDALESPPPRDLPAVGDCIREYFDPQSGFFTHRVRSLVGHGDEAGELERIIRNQVDGDGSVLSRTLAANLGDQSPLMKVLDPRRPMA